MSDQQQEPQAGADPTLAARELGGAEAYQLRKQVQSGDFSGMRQYLAQTRQARDWQDRSFILGVVAPFIQEEALTDASASEPEAADLLFLLGAYYFHRMGQSRGTKVAEQTSEEQFEDAHRQLQRMMDCLARVYRLDPEDPTPHVHAMRGLVAFGQYEDHLKQEYTAAVRLAPDYVPAHFSMVNARSRKWGGSHEEALHVARVAQEASRPGSDMPVCLFLAHFFVWQYARMFDKNTEEAQRYLKNKSVERELDEALDRWVNGTYEARRSSVPYFHEAALWYYLSGDSVRLKRVLDLAGGIPCDRIWSQIGRPENVYQGALQKAAAAQPKKSGLLGWFQR